eukprot:Skav221130  [mRNA]  locus=scaffold233:612078:613889:- [translate_table: standard]
MLLLVLFRPRTPAEWVLQLQFRRLGVPGVLWLQCIICVLGAVVSTAYLKHDWEYPQSTEEGRSFRNQVADSVEVTPPLVD